jgi:hypothetical protein
VQGDDDGAGILLNRFFRGQKRQETPPVARQEPDRPSKPKFGNVNRDVRKANERKSTRTAKQREHRAQRTAVINFRCTEELRDSVEAAAQAMGITRTDLIEQGIAIMLRRQARGRKTGEADA